MSDQMPDHSREPWLEPVIDELRRPVSFDPGFDARVMARVRSAAPESRWGALARWWTEPRAIALSPLGGLALAAGVAALLVTGLLVFRRPPAERLVAEEPQAVQFVFVAPGASRVALVGDFNDWNATTTPLANTNGEQGLWTVTVPLSSGRHEYAFVVDGKEWRPDPAAPRAPAGDYGAPNSVVTVSVRAS